MPDSTGRPDLAGFRLLLVDLAPQVVAAWRSAIAEAGLDRWLPELVEGPILEVGADAVASPGDSFGTMEGGLDLAVVDRHGAQVRDRVQAAIAEQARGELPVGQAVVVPLGGEPAGPGRPAYLVTAPTMRVPMRLPPDTVHPYLAMRAVLHAVLHGTVRELDGRVRPVREVVDTVAVPGLGTGTGRVDPEVAARQMVAAVASVLDPPVRVPRRWEQLVAEHRALTTVGVRPATSRVSMSQPRGTIVSSARGTVPGPRGRRAGQEASMQQATAPARGPQLAGRFAQAVAYAATAHGDQVRKGTDLSYVSHLLAVAALVLEHGGTELQAVAAVLHDVVEDCGGTQRLDDVRATFGDEVAQLVHDLSDAAPAPGEAKAPWRQRKQDYLDHLAGLAEAGAPAVLVSCCDKLHNAEAIVADATDPTGDPGLAVFGRFTAPPDGTAWYYRRLADTFAEADLPARLVARFERAVAELTRLAASADAASPTPDGAS